MRLLALGVSHHTAPIDLRERLAFAAADLGAAVSTLHGTFFGKGAAGSGT